MLFQGGHHPVDLVRCQERRRTPPEVDGFKPLTSGGGKLDFLDQGLDVLLNQASSAQTRGKITVAAAGFAERNVKIETGR
jgi:hypothetical protein